MGINKKRRYVPRLAKRQRPHAMMVRVPEAEWRLFDKRAAKDGRSLSSWARMILLREVQTESEDDK